MSIKINLIAALSVIIFLTVSSCRSQQVHQIEVCLKNYEERDDFYEYMRNVASVNNLDFSDGSESVAASARIFGNYDEIVPEDGLIYFGAIDRKTSAGFIVGNIGLNSLQLSIGLSPDKDGSFDDNYINRIIYDIENRWISHKIDNNESSVPRTGCGDGAY